jgi:hypothetical protein
MVDALSHHAYDFGVRKGLPAAQLHRSNLLEDGKRRCEAPMEIITNDMPRHGVLIHGPGSPGFRDRLFALVDVPPELEDDALRHSIVVENQSPQHILTISLVWRRYSQEDSKYIREFDPRNRNECSRLARNGLLPILERVDIRIDPVFTQMSWGVSWGLIKAGAQFPWSLLEGPGFHRHKAVLARTDARVVERRENIKAQLARNDRWSVDVDGVLFSDGVFAGPDTFLWFDHFEAEVRAARDLIAELNRMLDNGEDALARAEQCASITNEQLADLYPAATPNAQAYGLTKKVTAKNVIARRQKSGVQAAVVWIRECAKFQIPLVRR